MKLLLPLILLSLCLFGCVSVQQQYAEAEQATVDTVGAEWWATTQAAHEAGTLTDEEFERRERKWYSWRYRVATALDQPIGEPDAPTPKELAESTLADLATLE